MHPSQLVALLSGHLTVVTIHLVPHQHQLCVGRAILSCVVNPLRNIEEGRTVGDVIHHHYSLGEGEEGKSLGVKCVSHDVT